MPALAVVLVGIVLYAIRPGELILGTRYLVPALELVLLVLLVAMNTRRLDRETRLSRTLSTAVVGVIGAANLVSLALLVHGLVTGDPGEGKRLLLAAMGVWLTNIIVFGLAYWELDRWGPFSERSSLGKSCLTPTSASPRTRTTTPSTRWPPRRLPRPTGPRPLVDYLYVSVTNSTAFSTTDTMPLSTRAKLLMSVQCIAALLTSLIVIARAVSALQ